MILRERLSPVSCWRWVRAWIRPPNVVTEAHAVGVPVVATSAGGIPEMIRDSEDGFLVPVDDPEAMASKIDLLLGDTTVRQGHGSKRSPKSRRTQRP